MMIRSNLDSIGWRRSVARLRTRTRLETSQLSWKVRLHLNCKCIDRQSLSCLFNYVQTEIHNKLK